VPKLGVCVLVDTPRAADAEVAPDIGRREEAQFR
jgi:hypothetical protein